VLFDQITGLNVDMSYHLYIKSKRNCEQGEDEPCGIALEDWLAAVEGDTDFSCIVNEGDCGSALFQGNNSAEYMTWSDGHIDVDAPSEKLLVKMVDLANTLNARVIGDTGESYPQSNSAYLISAINK